LRASVYAAIAANTSRIRAASAFISAHATSSSARAHASLF
jgi:hypothetical protein